MLRNPPKGHFRVTLTTSAFTYINADKSKCIHFRKGRVPRSEFLFKIGDSTLETVDRYKYLGVIFNEKNDFTLNSEALSKAAGRALGGVINKIHNMKEFGFNAYQKLYTSCVVPIMDYCSSVWGFKKSQQLDNIQHRAMRYFLGVHRFTPVLAMIGDIGWTPCTYRRWGNMMRMWNRLVTMDDTRITKKAFNMDYAKCNNNWCQEVKQIMATLGIQETYDRKNPIHLPRVYELIHDHYSNIWSRDVQNVPKLRTYRIFKASFQCEAYVHLNLSKSERSVLFQFRSGILPLRIETGRYVGEPVEQRLCKLCDANDVEDEKHVLLYCSLYTNLRLNDFKDLFTFTEDMDTNQRLTFVINNRPRMLAKFLLSVIRLRRSKLYV